MSRILRIGLSLVLLFGLVNSLTYTLKPDGEILSEVNERFLSITLDTGKLDSANLTNPYFAQLVSYLNPVYLRIGGTTADTVHFEDDTKPDFAGKYEDDTILTGSYWLKLAEFAKKSKVRILFDLNSLKRNEDGSWNSENAENLFKFSQDNDIDLDWELGNEPDLYKYIYNLQVNSSQLAKDYINLRNILDKYELFSKSLLVGPSMFDTGSNDETKSYLENFLSEGSTAIYAVTWHQYYFSREEATEDLFLNPATFNFMEQRTKVLTDIVGTSKKIWLGETSSCNHQGAPGMTDRFLATFLWLDKLGLGAQLGLDLIARQTIWGYDYPLLDVDYSPNPDYYISYIYKRTVGSKVLSLTQDGDENRSIRLYAHCAPESDEWGDNAITLFGVNIASSSETFTLDGLGVDIFDGSKYHAHVYEITADDLYSKIIRLNNEELNISEDFELPTIESKIVDLESYNFTMPAHSLTFIVLPNNGINACKN